MPATDKTTPRGRCYHAVRHQFTTAIVEYVKTHPQMATEDVNELDAAAFALIRLMDRVLDVLDGYEIEDSRT